MVTDNDLVLTERIEKSVVLLRLNRPAKRNALSNAMLNQLADSIRVLEQEKSIRCIVLAGHDVAFCAGSDIKEFVSDGLNAIGNKRRKESWLCIQNTSIPIIVAVSGVCMGAGHELAMMCDMVVADRNALFGQPEIKLGHIPGDGATQRLPRLIGKHRAMKMILTGEPITGQQAYELGLLTEVTSSGMAEQTAIAIAKQVAKHSSVALGLAKDAVRASEYLGLEQGLLKERQNIVKAFTSYDQKEGLNAFLEKRVANFRDK